MRNSMFSLLFVLATASPAVAANGHAGNPDLQIMFDMSRAPIDQHDGSTLFWEMTFDGEPAGYVIVRGLGIDGHECQHLHYNEAWEYHLDVPLDDGSRLTGELVVERSNGQLSFCNDDWYSILDGQVKQADGDFAGLEGSWIRMDAVFAGTTMQCICSFFFGE